KMRNLFILFLIANTHIMSAQTLQNSIKPLYFISGTPSVYSDNKKEESFILRLKDNELLVKDTIACHANEYLLYVRNYPKKKYTFICKENFINGNNEFITISHNNLENINTSKKLLNDYINKSPISIIKNNDLVLNNVSIINQDTIQFKGINSNLRPYNFDVNDFKRSYLNGNISYPIREFAKQLYVTDNENGKLKMALTRDIFKRPIFPIELDESFLRYKKRYMYSVVNNDKYFILHLENNASKKEKIFGVYHKNKNEWHQLILPGSKTKIQNYGDWISGTVIYDNKLYQRKKRSRKDIFFYLEKQAKSNYSGVIFIHNLLSNRYLELNLQEPDSEILLIEDETIFYRCFDEIWKVSIIENKKIGTPKLLIKSKVVPEIHYMFSSTS
ncbi:MAG: hypothetical protein MI739_06615, partial [Bacteroidales bacterium]|nr:hypothetical protein [Bacteroidales bacterium]